MPACLRLFSVGTTVTIRDVNIEIWLNNFDGIWRAGKMTVKNFKILPCNFDF